MNKTLGNYENMERRSRLKTMYNEVIAPGLKEKFAIENIHAIPKITKVLVTMCVDNKRCGQKNADGTVSSGNKIEKNANDLTAITGQLAYITKAKKSIAQFGVRAGNAAGAMTTLRGNNMFHFLDRLISIGLINWTLFNGCSSRSFNKQKYVSFSLGVKDRRIFPEIMDESSDTDGLSITIVSNATEIEHLKFILVSLGLPFNDE